MIAQGAREGRDLGGGGGAYTRQKPCAGTLALKWGGGGRIFEGGVFSRHYGMSYRENLLGIHESASFLPHQQLQIIESLTI